MGWIIKIIGSILVSYFTLSCYSTSQQPYSTDSPSLTLESQIQAHINTLEAKSSLYAKHLPSGRQIEIRADIPMNSVSVIKIAIMVLAYRDAENGRLNLEERYLLRQRDKRRGSGVLQSFSEGLKPTYRDLITQMIITSDNTATDIVIKKVGIERVNIKLKSLGYKETRLQHRQKMQNKITPLYKHEN